MNAKENPQKNHSVAIIGAGFAGTLLAANLIQKLPKNLSLQISLIDKSGIFSQGPAYATKDPDHLLNVRVKRMGAFKDDPEHFLKWITANENIWKPLFQNLAIDGDSYVPRELYGIYLKSILNQTLADAKRKNAIVSCVAEEAVEVNVEPPSNRLVVKLKNGSEIVADTAILATNIPFHNSFDIRPEVPTEAYLSSIWSMPANHPLSAPNLNHLSTETRIGIIGSGLTMIDASVSLIKNGFKGKILVLSKHGQLPEPHLTKDCPSITPPFAALPESCHILFKTIRKDIKASNLKGINWRAVIDSLRPITIALWEQLPLKEKKLFVRHLLSFWNKLRHRVPPQSYDIVANFKQKGCLECISARVKAIQKPLGSNRVQIVSEKIVEVDYVINCSGPQTDLLKSNNPLLKSMIKSGIIMPHPLNMGLCVDDHYRLSGTSLPIYAMGQLLIGQKLETVAVPELREQCAFIANDIFLKYES